MRGFHQFSNNNVNQYVDTLPLFQPLFVIAGYPSWKYVSIQYDAPIHTISYKEFLNLEDA